MDKYVWLFLIVVPLYQLGLAILMYVILSGKIRKMMFQKKIDIAYNFTATVAEDVVLYDIPAFAVGHKVEEVKEGTRVVIKEIKYMKDGRWYLIEVGSKVGYCPKGNLIL